MATGCASDVDFEDFEKVDFECLANPQNYINKGSFGEVFGPFMWNSRKCALKRIWISVGRPGDEIENKVKDKKSIWTSLKHKHLIEIHNVTLELKALYLVMEYANGGSLRNLLDNFDITVHRQINVPNWATQIAEGMLYLHEKNIVHRDLKSGNIVLMDPFESLNTHKEMTLKIVDFDEVKEHDHTTIMSRRGTYVYMAPEVMMSEQFSKASDVWSYGIVMWEMLTMKRPHDGVGSTAIVLKALKNQLKLSIPPSIPEVCEKLLCDCWELDTKSRPTFKEIVEQLSRTDTDGGKVELRYQSVPVLTQEIRIKATDKGNKWIRGMTILGKELFIVYRESTEVEIYDSIKLTLCDRWSLMELVNPQDIASCNKSQCLYIHDYKGLWKSNEIFRVAPCGHVLNKWSTGKDYGDGLYVTEEFNVILSVYNRNKLNEYSPDGQLIREIKLSSHTNIRHPLHAIKLANGHFVVSHGFSGDEPHRVCIVDADGMLQKSFGGVAGSTFGHLYHPVHLFVDGNGLILVTDEWNARVLLLDSDLEFQGEILSNKTHGLRRPMRILLDESNNRVFLSDNDLNSDARILIFDL